MRLKVLEPSKNRRAIVSVAFSRQDFATVSARARELGKKTSEYIREAALSSAEGRANSPVITGTIPSGEFIRVWLESKVDSATEAPPVDSSMERCDNQGDRGQP